MSTHEIDPTLLAIFEQQLADADSTDAVNQVVAQMIVSAPSSLSALGSLLRSTRTRVRRAAA
jgi:hypothetical protein